MTRRAPASCCIPKPLKDRPLLSPIQAGGLAAVFKVLANDTRLRLLHALVRADELGVNDLAAAVGMKPQAVSNQLQRLSDLGVLASRREGKSIIYRLVDLCVASLLDQSLCLMEESNSRRTLLERAAAEGDE
jgi:ArsR family transcriptional regulator, lead/cadmium/zinc/bismuth-responsive transcriptional repressor